MKKRNLKKVVTTVLALSMLVPSVLSVNALESSKSMKQSWKTNLKDHWSFESGVITSNNQNKVKSDAGERSEGVLNDITVEDTGNAVFGKALKFGSGANKYMRLNDYIDTGYEKTTYSMWYKYDTKITENVANASAVLLQHENKNNKEGRTILSLTPDGRYDTFVNKKNAPTTKSVDKNEWQHITVVFDQTTKKVKYYINGELEGTEKDLGNNVTVGERLPLRIGAHKNTGQEDPHPMRGFVDEIYVYKRALSADEAKSLYADKAEKLIKLDIDALIKEGESLIENGGLPEENDLHRDLAVAIEAARQALEETLDIDAIKDVKRNLSEAIDNYKAKQPIDLTVNTDKVTQTIDSDSIFGINHRYAFNGYGTFDSKTMKVKDDFKKLYEDAGFGSIRYPGGTISNLFNWKTTLGPKEQRKNQIHGFYNTTNNGKDQGGIAPNFGIGEIATFADEVNSEIVYVYSLGRGSAQDAADLVEYLNAEVGTNPNGGIDWAEVRARNGHKDPYNVRYFEIGNEMNQGGENGAGDGEYSQMYWTSYVNGKKPQDAYIDGGTAVFNKKYAVKEEDWHKSASRSDGTANQVRYLRYANVNPGKLVNDKIVVDPNFQAMEKEGLEIHVGKDGNTVQWTIVDDFQNYGPMERVCKVDYTTGAIIFGDGVNGKIPEKGNNIYATYKVKRDGFIDISKAIKETTDKINKAEGKKLAANVYTSFESHEFFDKMKQRSAEALYDGMTIHPYSDPVSGLDNTATFYDNAMYRAEQSGIKKVTDLTKHMPKGKVPVISEYGIFRNTQTQLRSQTHAIYIAKVLMEYVRLGSPYIQKHCLTDWYTSGADTLGPTQQAVIQVVEGKDADKNTGEGEYTFFSTPSAHVFKMLNSGFGDNIIESVFSEVPTMSNGVKTLSALASKDNDGNVYIAIVNADRERDRSIQLNINGLDVTGRKMNIQRLKTDSFTSANTKENPNAVNVTYDDEVVLNENPVIHLDKHSFVIVKINDVDKHELQKEVDLTKELIKEHYTNFNIVEEVLNHAIALLSDKDATQAQIDEAVKELIMAKEQLVMKNADYSEVDKAIVEAKKLNKKEYKDFTKVEEAIKAVERGKKINEQDAVDAMAQKIKDAIAALEKIDPATTTPQVKPDASSPTTGDGSTPILWMALLVVTGGVFVKTRKSLIKR